MKAKEIRRRTDGDLREELKRLSQESFEHRFKAHSEETPDRGFLKRTRRDVARIHTVLRERERAGGGPEAAPAAPPAPAPRPAPKKTRKG
jgi:large subunit ribosomal protein L29